MNILPKELVRKKRDGERLTAEELRAFIAGVTDDSIPDDQVAAMLMAIFFRGLDDDELFVWADAMLHSGDVLDLSSTDAVKVDKHSTGGVGDKISIPLAPTVAACGVAVPMVSGRGLGHTGGTLDKLESIPGFRVDLSVDAFKKQVATIGACLIGQTDNIAPADRRLYALRDATSTVESIPLIASSIMSKKLAEGIDGLVLDCKVGGGAFMKTQDEARKLAKTMQVIGRAANKKVHVVLSNMDQPIGQTVGNALEIEESIDILKNGGPADARELTVVLGAEMLLVAGQVTNVSDGRAAIENALANGQALERFRQIVEAQGGDGRVCDDPKAVLPQAPNKHELLAPRAGVIAGVDARAIGMAALVLGGGRKQKTDAVDPAVGVLVHARVGDHVEKNQPLATLCVRDAGLDGALARTKQAFVIGDGPKDKPELIHAILREEH